jgi:hydrogenase-4 component B
MLPVVLLATAVLIGLAIVAPIITRDDVRRKVIYGASGLIAALLVVWGLRQLLLSSAPQAIVLPLALPWLGAHFRLDLLSAAFLIVVNLGAAAASLFAIGYGRHEEAPGRVLPFYPLFLAAMNLVVLAGDAFTFLLSWELMSLASWALVVAQHRVPGNLRAGYVYLLMAGFGTGALLLAFAVPPAIHLGWQGWCWRWRCLEQGRRPGWCPCTSGCRSPIRRPRATSRR